MTTRIARCCCGALRAEVTGEPPRVGVCHCMECQRRTGSAFGVVAFPVAEGPLYGILFPPMTRARTREATDTGATPLRPDG